VFGEVAGLYDARRPGYPDALYDDLLAAAPGARRVLEAGAGTGRATLALARRGLEVVAVEPDAAMAAIARRATDGLAVAVVESAFESYDPEPGSFDLVVSAQAWHWVDPAAGLAVARRALRPGGVLAVWWNQPDDNDGLVWRAVQAAYERHAPALARGPVNRPGLQRVDPDVLGAPEERVYRFTETYDTAAYIELVQTHSDHRMLPPAELRPLLDGIAAAIDTAGGGGLDYRYRTRLLLARTS